MRGWRITAKEYFPKLIYQAWVVIFVVILGTIGSALLAIKWEKVTIFSIWGLVVAALIGLAIAQFILFHKIRVERDTIRQDKDRLQYFTDYEKLLDVLSVLFDYGNNKIFNASIKNDVEFGAWEVDWKRWGDEVQEFLEENFGLRERNLFKNIVLYEIIAFPDHHRERSMVAQQLAMLRATIVRYSDRVQGWRADEKQPPEKSDK